MYPVLKKMHMLNFLDTFSVGITLFNPQNAFRPLEEFPCSQLEFSTQGLHSCTTPVSLTPPQAELSLPQLPNEYCHYAFHLATPSQMLITSILTSASPD